MLLQLDTDREHLVLGALRQVATAHGADPLSEIDASLLVAVHHLVFGRAEPIDLDALPSPAPATLAEGLRGTEVHSDVAKCCVVAALTDGVIDADRLILATVYADALGVHGGFVEDAAALAHGEVQFAMGDMLRRNVESFVNGPATVNPEAWIHPYTQRPNPELNERYRALASSREGTLGHAFFHWYDDHGFAFPGVPEALSEEFSTPHDTAHLLSGYDTTQQGELLVSTFTSALHRRDSMAAHVMPVILSWHVGLALNSVAGASHHAFDPPKFFKAWERGHRTTLDVFARDWNFWDHVDTPLDELRATAHVPPLEPQYAANAPDDEGYEPIA